MGGKKKESSETKTVKEKKRPAWKCEMCKGPAYKDEAFIHGPYHYCKTCEPIKKTLIEENNDWIDLCKYIEKKIMKYDENQTLTTAFCRRLRGLRVGTFAGKVPNTKKCDYPYKVIYYTFVTKSQDILKACESIRFKDESHKINYIMQIVENSINDVYERMKKKAEATRIIEEAPVDNTFVLAVEGAEYKKKEQKKDTSLEGLW